jgi:SAM-dependent methyltransferase
MMDLHQGFRDPAQAQSSELIAFLETVDGLPGTQAVHGALRRALEPRRGMRLLDAGCGIGLETRRLAWDYPGLSVTGLDRNRDLLAVARQDDCVDWVEGDLNALGLPEASFDLVRTDRVLMYLPGESFQAAVSALTRLIRPGGRAAFFELDYGATLLAPGGATDAVVKRATIALEAALPQPWAGRRLPALLAANGMRDIQAEPISFAVPEPVWRRIVHDSLIALDAGISDWLAEQAQAARRGEFVAAFTGVLSTGRRARFPASSAAR